MSYAFILLCAASTTSQKSFHVSKKPTHPLLNINSGDKRPVLFLCLTFKHNLNVQDQLYPSSTKVLYLSKTPLQRRMDVPPTERRYRTLGSSSPPVYQHILRAEGKPILAPLHFWSVAVKKVQRNL